MVRQDLAPPLPHLLDQDVLVGFLLFHPTYSNQSISGVTIRGVRSPSLRLMTVR